VGTVFVDAPTAPTAMHNKTTSLIMARSDGPTIMAALGFFVVGQEGCQLLMSSNVSVWCFLSKGVLVQIDVSISLLKADSAKDT
jgi:hypothetical protein